MKSDFDLRQIELAIFELLSDGCTTFSEIQDCLHKKFPAHANLHFTESPSPEIIENNITENSTQGDETKKRTSRLSVESLYKILSMLRKNDLIQSHRYFDRHKGRNFVLYANTANSVELLIESDYRHNHVRSPYLPGKFGYPHDRDLTRVVRKLKQDATIYLYQFGFQDEYSIRRSSDKSKKGALYPDLKLSMKTNEGGEYFFRIEIQRSSDRIEEFANKLKKTNNNLVLFKERRLLRDLADTKIYVQNNAIFANIEEFLIRGIFETKWLSAKGTIVGLIYSRG